MDETNSEGPKPRPTRRTRPRARISWGSGAHVVPADAKKEVTSSCASAIGANQIGLGGSGGNEQIACCHAQPETLSDFHDSHTKRQGRGVDDSK